MTSRSARKPLEFATVTPQEWTELARQHDRPEADGIFLSCTNTTQIEAVADIERALGKPVVNSNQAVLWGCVQRLKPALGPLRADAAARAASWGTWMRDKQSSRGVHMT